MEKRKSEVALMDNISSSSKRTNSGNYDVFLSFRGADTRNNFTAYLYDRLITVGFNVYKDDREMNKGDEINENLKRAISNSRICIPIFSRTYASSKPCLRELSHMIESKKEIIPIFFDVTPDDVKLKTSMYKKALEDHRQSSEIELEEVDKWENALSIATGKAGFDIANKNQAEEITAITRELIIRLMPKYQDVTDHLVEIDNELRHVESLLDLNSSGFRIIGIFGMGGIGKTTLAKLIFNRYCSKFPSCCSFLANVRENLQSMKLLELQRQLYKDIISSSLTGLIQDPSDGINQIKKGLENKKVLLIFDDMDSESQLTDLLGHPVRFASGSRIIITTRNKRILDDLKQDLDLLAYELKEMDFNRAVKLFSKNAFRRDFPPKEFQALSEQVISYIKGIPLALEIFGSLLRGRSKEAWKEMITELKQFPDKRIQDRLMMSYQGLKSNQKEIFLDIACYHGELNSTLACCMWKDHNWYPKPAIQALQDHSLIKVIFSPYNDEILWMHDVLKDLGRAIVREESKESGWIRRRLQIEDTIDIPHEKKARVETLSISNATITRKDMIGLCQLRFLELSHCTVMGNFEGSFPNLRWLSLNFPPSFEQTNSYWEGWGTIEANKLKALSLEFYKWNMLEVPFKKFSSLEVLMLDGCEDLTNNNVTSIIELKNLMQLSIRYTGLHDSINWIGKLTSLCKLEISDTGITELPDSIGHLKQLKELRVYNCSSLERVPELPLSLTHLHLHGVSKKMQVDWSSQFKLTNIIELELSCEDPDYFTSDDLSFEWIRSATNLKKLHFHLPYYITTDQGEVNELLRLEHLSISHAGFEYLQHLPSSLLHLECYFCGIPNGILDVSNLKDLEHLEIYEDGIYDEDDEDDEGDEGDDEDDEGDDEDDEADEGDDEDDEGDDEDDEGDEGDDEDDEADEGDDEDDEADEGDDEGVVEDDRLVERDVEYDRLLEMAVKATLVEKVVEIKGLGESLHVLHLNYCSKLKNIHVLGALNELESLKLFKCASIKCVPNLSKSRKLKLLDIGFCQKLRNIQGLAELESLKHVKFVCCHSLELSDADLSKLEDNAQNMTLYIHGCNKLRHGRPAQSSYTAHTTMPRNQSP